MSLKPYIPSLIVIARNGDIIMNKLKEVTETMLKSECNLI